MIALKSTGYIRVASATLNIAPDGFALMISTNQFYRSAAESTRETTGTGLGLAVVWGIVERHGGSLLVRSQPDQGTSIEVWLPGHAPPPAQAAPLEEEAEPVPGQGVAMEVDRFFGSFDLETDYPDERRDLIEIELDREEDDLVTVEVSCERFGPGGFMGFGRELLYEQSPVRFVLQRTVSTQPARVWIVKSR